MSLEALLAELDADGAREREAVLTEAGEESRRIRAASATTVERRREEHLSAVRAEEERDALTAVSRARSEARRLVLDRRHAVAQRVRSAVGRRIESSADDPGYLEVVPREIAEARRRAPAGEATLRVAPDLRQRLERSGGTTEQSELTMTADSGLSSGFQLVADGGRVVVDGTLDLRLRLDWRRLAAYVLRELEG